MEVSHFCCIASILARSAANSANSGLKATSGLYLFMADNPDPNKLARQYLDLWQQQLTHAAKDSELATAMTKFWEALPVAVTPGNHGWTMGGANTGKTNDDKGHTETATGSSPNPASPDSSSNAIGELLDRMAALEKRLDALESKSLKTGKRAAKGSAKSKP